MFRNKLWNTHTGLDPQKGSVNVISLRNSDAFNFKTLVFASAEDQ